MGIPTLSKDRSIVALGYGNTIGKQHLRVLLLCLCSLLVLFAGIGHAAQVTLAWDRNPELDIAGYKLYYGTGSRVYNWFIDVGNATTYTVTDLSDKATYYFAATAYDTSGVESTFSTEAVWYNVSAELPVSEITIGSRFTVTGSGLGVKKGKVLIGNVAAKIDNWSIDSIACTVTKVPLPTGPHDVMIKPQPYKAIPPLILPGTLTVMSPEINLLSSNRGSAGDEITVTGKFFSTKKGKVYLEYEKNGQIKKKNCPIKSWDMNSTTGGSELIFVVPKSLNPGSYPLKVTNKVGAAETTFRVDP
jgi:hypothetical protein